MMRMWHAIAADLSLMRVASAFLGIQYTFLIQFN